MAQSKGARSVFRRVVFVYQMLLAVVGAAVGVASLSVLFGSEGALLPKALPGAGVAVCAVLLALCPLGAYGTTENAGQRGVRAAALVTYALGVTAAVVAAILAGVAAESLLGDQAAMDAHLSAAWEGMDDARVAKTQAVAQCCGFADTYDRVLEPCVRYTPAVGCVDVLRAELVSAIEGTLAPAAALALCGLLGVVLDLVVLVVLAVEYGRDRRSPRLWSSSGAPMKAAAGASGATCSPSASTDSAAVASSARTSAPRPSYDAWHKAVFRSS